MKNRQAVTPEMEKTDTLNRVGWTVMTLGLATIPLVYFFNRLITEYYWIKAFWTHLLMPIPLILMLFGWFRAKRVVYPRAKLLWPYLLFIVIAVQSTIGASNPFKSWDLILKISGGFFGFLTVYHYVDSRQRLRTFINWMLFAAFLVTLYGLAQYTEIFYLPRDQYKTPDPSTTIGLTNFVVEYLIVMMAMIPLAFFFEHRRPVRALLAVGGASIFVYYLISDNRAGYVALLAQFSVIAAVVAWDTLKGERRIGLQPKQLGMIVAIVVAVAGIGLTVTPMGGKLIKRLATIGNVTSDASIRFRIETWKQGIKMIPSAPVRGVGLANLEVEFPRHYTPFIEGMTLRHNTRVVRSHNEYVQVLVDLGILGGLSFGWLLWSLFGVARETGRLAHKRSEFALYVAFVGGFVGFLTVAFFAFPFQVPSSSVYFFAFAALFDRFRLLLKEDAGEGAEATTYDLQLDDTTKFVPLVGSVAFLGTQMITMDICFNALTGEVRNKEARVYKDLRRWDETLAIMNDALDHHPYMEGYYYDRAVAHMHFKNNKAALDDLKETRRLVPNYGMGRKQIGRLALQMQDFDLAISELEKALEIFPSQVKEIGHMIASAAISGNQTDVAVKYLTRIVEEEQAEATTYMLLGNAYGFAKEYTAAADAYEKALEIDPSNPEYWINYGSVLIQSNQPHLADPVLTRVVQELDPRNPRAWYTYARLKALQNDLDTAEKALKRAIGLSPDQKRRASRDQLLMQHERLRQWVQ